MILYVCPFRNILFAFLIKGNVSESLTSPLFAEINVENILSEARALIGVFSCHGRVSSLHTLRGQRRANGGRGEYIYSMYCIFLHILLSVKYLQYTCFMKTYLYNMCTK